MSRRNSLESKALRRFLPKAPATFIAPRNPAVKVALRLQKLPLQKLHRRLAQTARRAATCRYLIQSLSPNSMFSVAIRQEQTHQISLLRQLRAEITSRIPKKS